jgi:acyl-CoA hydrolase/GNAT superfamily N-acetyltransferase
MPSWKETYQNKIVAAQKAIGLIRPGSRIFIGTGCGQPQVLVDELVKSSNAIEDAEIYHLLTRGTAPYIREEYARKFRTCSFFLAPNVREGIVSGRGDYIPIGLSDIPALFKSGRIPLDVALIQTSPPDKNGYLSLGISVDIVKSAMENSLMVIAEVNEHMPQTHGETTVRADMVDAIVESDRPLLEYSLPQPDETVEAIARNVASLVEDGSTIEVGIGTIPQAVLHYLSEKNDLGVHTEMFNDAIIPLIESGVINGSRKTLNRGKITASFCLGTRELYDYIHQNQLFDFRPTEYVNDPYVIGQHTKMVAINVAIEIDMTGQVCSDSIGYDFYSGIGGQLDFNRGASRAREGKAIIALPSTAKDGSISRIVPKLTEGAGVVIPRGDTRYVVTEYGIADLFGKSVRERVLALAEIAHPDYRNDILNEAKKRRYVFEHQKVFSGKAADYPKEFETRRTLSDGTVLFIRPVKPSDNDALRDMCYTLSEKSIAFRFFQPIKSFPHKFIQDFTNIDYSRDMAIAALVKDTGGERIIGVAHYFLNKKGDRAEVSFLVREDWQSKGIGTHLLHILADIARNRHIEGFDASVLANNYQMLSVFYNSGFEVTTKRQEDMYHISFPI